MKRFTALCLALIMCVIFPSLGLAGYDASEYQVKPYTDYLTDCKGFVSAVLAKEQGVSLPPYDATMRYYPNNDNYLVGGKLLNSESYTATTFENIKALFDNAEVGDVVQMYWDTGDTYSSQHTVIVSATNKANNKVSFLHSNWWPHFTYAEITNTEFSYSTIADCCTKAINKPFHDGTYKYGGISLYRFSGSVTPLPEGSVRIDAENFPDEVFRSYVLRKCDTNGDEILSAEEAASVETMNVSIIYTGNFPRITDLKGIEYFTALRGLDCGGNRLTTLDLSNNTALKVLWCHANHFLTELNVSKNTQLEALYCYYNQLTALDLSNNTALTVLDCHNNQLTALDVSKNTALKELR
ncbi:MAG: leucine-rich repeat domain-containing protein, partial [Synergistaceae bacterium]|nr:leucine-rich repeat domain-containing protein [Synergistaceae bacterium]